jgi:hypothetical protein
MDGGAAEMTSTKLRGRAAIAGGLAAGVLAMTACAGGSHTSIALAQTHLGVADSPGFKIDKNALLHPAKKYFGISLAGVPQSVTTPITTIKQETGKRPNLVMYYQDWGTAAQALAGVPNFNATEAENACAAGMLPMMTWESWDTTQTTPGEGVSYTQPAFDMSNIIAGDFDQYIKETADAIASIGCPIAMRLDQEENGYWYPWGISNTTQNGTDVQATALEYIQMWRHVVRIFRAEGATNVIWTWSPNIQSLKSKILPPIGSSYPGNSWVNWVGLDGYYDSPTTTFANLLAPVLKQLSTVAPSKPWIISETGVAQSTAATKSAQITDLLDSVAGDSRLNGLIYFEQHKSTDRSNWLFTTSAKSLAAFKAGIDQKAYASGTPGDQWYLP